MAEQPIFWLGGSPGKQTSKPQPPEAERYEPAIREACEACGYQVDEYVAALGGFGGWLAHLERAGERYRVFWSGKSNLLSFEYARNPGGWQELGAAEVTDGSAPAFVEAVKELLVAPDIASDAAGTDNS